MVYQKPSSVESETTDAKYNWRDILIHADTPIISAMKIIDESTFQAAIVTDSNHTLLGTVTDGDIRRGILKGISVGSPVSLVMNNQPRSISKTESTADILKLMRTQSLHQIPVVDENNRIVKIEFLDELLKPKKLSNKVVLMAGGTGTRLLPLTKECPKPLLKIGNKPILEIIISQFRDCGFYRFCLTLNYKAEMLKNHFKDGQCFDVEIEYIHEDNPLGTAGALSLLLEKPDESLFVMNGDLLTNVDFKKLLEFHQNSGSVGTMCVREYDFEVPYGVVNVSEEGVLGIDEKPIQKFFVNAGIYILEPTALEYIPKNAHYDMTHLFEELIEQNKKVSAFPIREYWLDIGKMGDFIKANGEYNKVFSK